MCQQPHITRVQAGFEWNDDFNAERREGFAYYQINIHKGRRWGTARGYLAPARRHANLRIVTRAAAQHIVIREWRSPRRRV